MSRIDDGSDELEAAIDAVESWSNQKIADQLIAWSRDGIKIDWVDFVNRKILETAAFRLKGE